MSNQDANGIELPWILHTEEIPYGQWIPNLQYQIRHKIIPNPLWPHADVNSPTFAIISCFHQAIVNMNQSAGNAMILHIQDAWKWKD